MFAAGSSLRAIGRMLGRWPGSLMCELVRYLAGDALRATGSPTRPAAATTAETHYLLALAPGRFHAPRLALDTRTDSTGSGPVVS